MTKLRARFSRNSPPTAATDLTGKTALTWMVRKADMSTKLTTEIITAAILGFEEQKRHIDTKIAELRAMLSGGPAESAARPEGTPRKHKISAAARRRMAIAQRKRWAKIRDESEPPAPAKAPKAKRRISEEGMKRIEEDHRRHEEALAFTEGCFESSRKESRHKEDRCQKGGGEGCTNKGGEKGSARQEGCGQEGRCEGGPGCCTGGHGTCRSVEYRQEYFLNLGSISHSAARAAATASVQ